MGGIYKSLTRHVNVEIGAEAGALPFLGIFALNFRYCVLAVCSKSGSVQCAVQVTSHKLL
jgi:hypothetical protein